MHTIPEFLAAVDPRREHPGQANKEPYMSLPKTLAEKRATGGLFHSLSDIIAALREHSGVIRELTQEIREARETLRTTVAGQPRENAHLPQGPVVPR